MVEGKVGKGVGGGYGLGQGEWDRMRGTTVILTVNTGYVHVRYNITTAVHYY